MNLQNIHPQKKNTKVTVNGNVYHIGQDLVIRDPETKQPVDVPEADASKLLQGKAWREAGKPGELPDKKNFKMKPVMNDGSVPTDEDISTAVDTDNTRRTAEAENREGTGTIDTEGSGEGREDTIVDPPVPGDNEEWPDPTEALSIGYLRQMADAYEVKHNKRTKKLTLIKNIHKAMFDE